MALRCLMAEWPRRIRWQVVLDRSGAVALVLSLFLLVLVLPLGCANRVIPPAEVRDPVTIYLLDHGRTPSLVLPTSDGGMARYVYGDWRWYALNETHLFNGIGALLMPTQGGIGREWLGSPRDGEEVLMQVGVVTENIYPLVVERERAEALQAELDAIFVRNAETMVENRQLDLVFVHHPDRYTYFWNSNHKVALWLGEVGCEVRGPAFNSIWRVEQGGTAQGVSGQASSAGGGAGGQ